MAGFRVTVSRCVVAWILAVGLAGITGAGDTISLWRKGSDGLQGWTEPNGLTASAQNSVLVLQIRQRVNSLAHRRLQLDPAKVGGILIRYRATGFPQEQPGGSVYYENARHSFVEGYRLRIPPLVADGQWHELLLPVRGALEGIYNDWLDGGTVTALRFDMAYVEQGKVEIDAILAGPCLRLASGDDVIHPSSRVFLFSSGDFAAGGDTFTRTATLPEGRYTVWARVYANAEGRERLAGVRVDGVPPVTARMDGDERFCWVRVGGSSGGALTLTLDRQPSVFLDALLVAEGDAVPQDAPLRQPIPVKSEIQPPPPTAMQKVLGPYWTGTMIRHAQDGQPDPKTGQPRTFFRRTFDVPQDLEGAWLQVSVDDIYDLYVNGEKLGDRHEDWTTPEVYDLTPLLRKGARNVIAIEAINTGGPGGVLADLTLNRANRTTEKIVSDASWRCAAAPEDGWTRLDFNDTAWAAAIPQVAPPNAPWVVKLPYLDKSIQTPTAWIGCECPAALNAGDTLKLSFRFTSEKPIRPGEVLTVTLTDTRMGNIARKEERELTGQMLDQSPDGGCAVSGIEIPFSRWLSDTEFRVQAGIYGRTMTSAPTVTFALKRTAPQERLTSRVVNVDGVPRLEVNGKLVHPMFGNCEGFTSDGNAAFLNAGFNVICEWTNRMDSTIEWWVGPDEYNFARLDARLTARLDAAPDAWVLPILWAAPPPWWQEKYPGEMALFSDGRPWPYYRSAHSFASEQLRRDAARAIAAFVKHVESMPYASRILGYWIVGGVSAEWQGWGCHNCHTSDVLMDYSLPARNAFREFLRAKYGDAPEFAQAAVPAVPERLSRELGVFRDPAAAQRVIDYHEFYSESLVDCLLACTRAAKEAVSRSKIVGVYFGYTQEYANMNYCVQMSGHNRLRKALDSMDVDFFSAPHSYAVRAPGDAMGWMHCFRSMHNAGKLVWPDDDSRTFLAGPCDYHPAINLAQTVAVIQRNFATCLCRLTPQGFLQISSKRELHHPEIARVIRRIRKASEYALTHRVQRKAEVCVVVDEDSYKYLALDKTQHPSGDVVRILHWNGNMAFLDRPVNTLTGDLIGYQRDRIARIGAPYDTVLFSDLKTHPGDYKLYIMLCAVEYDDALLRAVQESLQRRPVAVLWCYAPGLIRNGKLDPRHMETLTGIRLEMQREPMSTQIRISDFTTPFTGGALRRTTFGAPYEIGPVFNVADPAAQVLGVYAQNGRPALALKKVGPSTQIFCGTNKLSADLLAQIAEGAGVHRYSTSLDPFEANESFLMLHASAAGAKSFRLKRPADVVDVCSGRVVARNSADFSVPMQAEETGVFFVGNAQEFTQAMGMEDTQPLLAP